LPPRNLITIGNTPLPPPSKYVGLTADIVDSARNVEGYVVGAIVRSDVGKVEADFNYISADEWSAILKLFNPKHGGSFYNDVTFFNQVTADWETRRMYVGDRTTSGAVKVDPDTGAVVGWLGAHLSLVEV
jgi:hypothetical protein